MFIIQWEWEKCSAGNNLTGNKAVHAVCINIISFSNMQNETTGSEQEKTKEELKTTLAEGIASIGQVCK